MLERPAAARALLDEVQAALPSLPALPSATFPMSELDAALTHMATGKHIGKILIATSAVDAHRQLPAVSGPAHDPLLRSLLALCPRASPAHAELPGEIGEIGGERGGAVGGAVGAASGRGTCVVIPDLPASDAELDALVRGARAVITRSRLVASRAIALGVDLAIEMRAPWGALSPQLARDALAYIGAGHVVLEEGAATDYAAVRTTQIDRAHAALRTCSRECALEARALNSSV